MKYYNSIKEIYNDNYCKLCNSWLYISFPYTTNNVKQFHIESTEFLNNKIRINFIIKNCYRIHLMIDNNFSLFGLDPAKISYLLTNVFTYGDLGFRICCTCTNCPNNSEKYIKTICFNNYCANIYSEIVETEDYHIFFFHVDNETKFIPNDDSNCNFSVKYIIDSSKIKTKIKQLIAIS